MKRVFIIGMVIGLIYCLILGGCTASVPTTGTASPNTSPATSSSVESINLKLSCSNPEQSAIWAAYIAPWMKDIQDSTGGRVKITGYPGGTLTTEDNAYEAVVSGMIDIGMLNIEAYPGRFPLAEFLSLPVVTSAYLANARATYEVLDKYSFNTELSEIKVLCTMSGMSGELHGNKPVHVLEDLKGYRMRSGGTIEQMGIEALGAIPVSVPREDLYTSLERGLVDGAMFTDEGCLAFGVNQVTKYRTKTDYAPKTFLLVMNRDKWESLPSDVKKIFEDHIGVQGSVYYSDILTKAQMQARDGLIAYDEKVGNPGYFELPQDELARWQKAVQSGVLDKWVADMQAKGKPGEALLDEYLTLLAKYSQQGK